jgi:endonuclease/exonuclease/phosphatase (EEP) superfamily protein YafD
MRSATGSTPLWLGLGLASLVLGWDGSRFSQEGQALSGGWATVRHPNGAFTVAATHFGWPFPAGPQQAQSRRLVASLERFPHDTLILTGDFNSTPWSWSLRRQDKALGLERRTRALASWPSGAFSRVAHAPFPFLPIDHVYAGKAWKTVKVARGPVLGSDHRPVVVILSR